MNIICEISPTTCIPAMRGWSNAFKGMGHSFTFYNTKGKSVFDAFDEYSPDILISTVNDVSRGMAKVLSEDSEVITVFYSPKFERLQQEDIDFVKELKNETGKPDLVFTFGEIENIKEWADLGFQTVSLPKASDPHFFYPVPYQTSWASDIALVGNYYEGLDEFIFPLCGQSEHSFRIFGDGDWPVPNYVGNVKPENMRNIFSSSRIVLDLPAKDGELSDIPFNVLACGGRCLSTVYEDFPGSIWTAKTPNEMLYFIEMFFYENNINLEHLSPSAYLIPDHSYDHRVKLLLKSVGLEDEIRETN